MLGYSRPRLSESRDKVSDPSSNVVHKAVTTWLNDIEYHEKQIYHQLDHENGYTLYKNIGLEKPLGYEIEHAIMLDVSRRIELATNLNVTTRNGAHMYQITNYGLAGMVSEHHDAWGYESGVELDKDHMDLASTGDYIATFIGWLEDTSAGGGTAFTNNLFEGILEPKKGSAAFWINLASCHGKDFRSTHAGCPVLKGSK